MYAPSDALTGSNQVSIELTKLDDGRVKATCPSLPLVPAAVAADSRDAISALKLGIRAHMEQGFRKA